MAQRVTPLRGRVPGVHASARQLAQRVTPLHGQLVPASHFSRSRAFMGKQRRLNRMPLDSHDFARLYDAHAREMLGFFVRRTYDPEVALDLVAETFARGFADRRRFRGTDDGEAIGWLYGIARHRLADYLRRGHVEQQALTRLGFQRRQTTDQEYERIEELAGLGALRGTLGPVLGELSEEHRAALQLRVVEERPYEQVARALGVNEQAARARVSRALAALRQMPAVQALQEGR